MTDPDRPSDALDAGPQTPPATDDPQRGGPFRKIILANTAALPVLVTLANGVAGFAAIHYATKSGLGAASMAHLAVAAWLIFAAMAFDALDGRLARMTRQASDFGAQLDSLCDGISFGVAPAVLMVQVVSMALTEQIKPFDAFQAEGSALGKAVMAIAVLYLCCTVLRLARFNIENAPDLLHHLEFTGLPSPAAAATVAAMVLLFEHLQSVEAGWKSAEWLKIGAGATLPAVTLLAALLMISGFRYTHLVNRLLISKKPFGYIVKVVIALVVVLLYPQLALALLAILYAASGPAGALLRKFRPRRVRRAA